MNECGDYEAVLEFWFGELDDGRADEAHVQRWFKKDPDFDRELTTRFGALHDRLSSGGCREWVQSARGRLAFIIVLDQFSRNMFRDTPRMYSTDALALQAALDGIEGGMDRQLIGDERTFFYMPLMHSEDIEMQRRCCQLFQELRNDVEGPLKDRIAYNLKYAEMHRDIVERFGRFPHRNAILDRTSTEEEHHFLKQPNSSF